MDLGADGESARVALYHLPVAGTGAGRAGSRPSAARGRRNAVPMTQRERALIILPTYNESENLEPITEAIRAVGPFHILVVDDNSPDGTGDLADSLAARYPGEVHVLHRAGKQ